MKSIFILFSVFVLSSVPVSHAQQITCEDVTIEDCPGLFADSCRNDVNFQEKNGFACLKVLNNSSQNQAFCASIDMAPCQSEDRDCSTIQNMRERFNCEDGFPKCTSGTPELKKRFNDLGKSVEAELESYGGVLDLDLDDVGDKKTLCGLTFDSMEMYHKQATMTDTPINRFLDQSREIASCAKEITAWVEDQEIDVADSDLQDELIKATAEDLKDLQPLREELNRSVSKLKEAGPKLYQLMKFHYRFCPNTEDGFPKCASGTPELKTRFLDLGKEVKVELESYGGVLDLDLDNVGDKKTLCELTFGSMERYYNQAVMTDTPINRFLVQSREIASCAKEITTWVENEKIAHADSDIQDNLIKVTAEDLKDLHPLREELNSSVSKLKEAEPKLYQLMKFHVRFCPSK